MDEISARISFGVGRNDGRSRRPPGARRDPRRRLRAAARAARPRRQAARHRRRRQPLRRPVRRRAGPRLGRRALRLARLRPQDRVRLPRAGAGTAVRRARAEGEMDAPPIAARGRLASSGRLRRGDEARRPLRLRRPRRRRAREVLDILGAEARSRRSTTTTTTPGARSTAARTCWVVRKGATPAFPGQRGFVGATMGEPARDPRGRRVGRRARGALLDRPRRRPRDVAHAGRRPEAPALGVPQLRLVPAAAHAQAGCLPAVRRRGRQALGPGLGGRDRLPARAGGPRRPGHRAARWGGRRGARRLQAAWTTCSPTTRAPCACCTRCARSASRWPARTRSIPTKIELV